MVEDDLYIQTPIDLDNFANTQQSPGQRWVMLSTAHPLPRQRLVNKILQELTQYNNVESRRWVTPLRKCLVFL